QIWKTQQWPQDWKRSVVSVACFKDFQRRKMAYFLFEYSIFSSLSLVPRKKFWVEKPITNVRKLDLETLVLKLLIVGNSLVVLWVGLRAFTALGKLVRNLEYKTTNGYLSVSPNGKSMMFTGLRMNKCQHGQRFDLEPRVLGSKGFTWGKVYWEVKVDRIWWEAEEEKDARRDRAGSRGVFGSRDLGGFIGFTDGYHSPGYREENEELEGEWSQEHGIWPKFCLVGVARESMGFWTLQLSSAGVSVCTSPEPFQILSYCPQQIGVSLDHDEFIYEFSSAFPGRIFPFLWLNCMRSRLTLRP
ncbi:hypothetical protein FD754_024819, partial [Muntiacus muntjak]